MITTLNNILLFCFSLICKLILLSTGWSLIGNDIMMRVANIDKAVVVFSHTSYVDFYILLLYLFSEPGKLDNVKILVKPQPFAYAGWILRKLGAIPATKVSEKNGGAVNRIVNQLKNQETFILLLSPKGTILKQEWRSGYYHIANELNAQIIAAGLDYETKSIHLSQGISSSFSEAHIKNYLMDYLSNIVPLYPECEIMPIRIYDENKKGIINWQCLFTTTIGLLIIFIGFFELMQTLPLSQLLF